MQRSSETIGAIAAALAKAQAELTNPEKALIATIRAANPREQRSDLSLRRAIERARHRAQGAGRPRDRNRPDDGDRPGGGAYPPHHHPRDAAANIASDVSGKAGVAPQTQPTRGAGRKASRDIRNVGGIASIGNVGDNSLRRKEKAVRPARTMLGPEQSAAV